jgi:peptidoglycan hydrolase CwlO-like protein
MEIDKIFTSYNVEFNSTTIAKELESYQNLLEEIEAKIDEAEDEVSEANDKFFESDACENLDQLNDAESKLLNIEEESDLIKDLILQIKTDIASNWK